MCTHAHIYTSTLQALVEACSAPAAGAGGAGSLESACNLALALASVGALTGGVERDRAVLVSQQAFTVEVCVVCLLLCVSAGAQ